MVVLIFLLSAAVIFYKNIVNEYRIGELLPFTFTVITINLYVLTKMIVTGVVIARTYEIFHENSQVPILVIVQFIMIAVGAIVCIYSSIMYLAIGPLMYEAQKEIIFNHLDGNQILFDNFLQVT